MTIEDILPALEGASFALVFGSFGTGRVRPESDLDLAVRYPKPLAQVKLLELTQSISEIAGRSVDLVDLGSADPIIAMQVLRHGRPLLVRDRAAFETIRSLSSPDNLGVKEWIRDDVSVLNLQRAVEALLDLANHLISANGWELPRDGRHAFAILRSSIFRDGLT